MHCPHCHGRLTGRTPAPNPGRNALHAHHGVIDLDADLLRALVANAREYLRHRGAIQKALSTLQRYREVVERLEFDPAFATHVLAYDGDGGRRFFPGATRAARLARLKERIASGDVREDDLARYIELTS